MTQIILANGKVLNAESVTLEPHFAMQVKDWDTFIEIVDCLNPENLLHVQIIKDDRAVAAFTDCELAGTQTVNNYDESMTAHFYLSGLPTGQSDPEYETAYKILIGELQA